MRLSPSQVADHIGAACRLACRNCVHFGYCCSHRQSRKWARQGRLSRRCRSPFRPLFSGLYAPLDIGCRRRSPELSPLRPRGLEPLTCGLEDRCSIQLSYGRNYRMPDPFKLPLARPISGDLPAVSKVSSDNGTVKDDAIAAESESPAVSARPAGRPASVALTAPRRSAPPGRCPWRA